MQQDKQNHDTYTTSDIGVAAFLQLRGCKLLVCKRADNGRFHFEFEDHDKQCEKLTFDFLNSDYCKFDNNVRNLKKILFSK